MWTSYGEKVHGLNFEHWKETKSLCNAPQLGFSHYITRRNGRPTLMKKSPHKVIIVLYVSPVLFIILCVTNLMQSEGHLHVASAPVTREV